MAIDWFSPAQCVGYAAFVLGVASFAQKDDRRFKLFMAAECLAYIIHFTLLGRPTAVASSTMSLLRSVLALYTRSKWVAFFVVMANLGLGWHFATRPSDWLPLGASCIGTLALFLMEGVRMRFAMLCGTVLWIVNNVIAGSVGGTALELVIACVNLVTIRRMLREAPAAPQA
ncbi:YgjV family protein [Massilia sp. IC2-477]|uniref:YgjV family protein n=1 Tax=Massilia sp. IC2-477 TaxID=2887198 RepID=UPI001D129C8A|nr:YgjV family protein [Massilia sp. IC2-477]MCC2958346.1 YgjV family protein [Massilia sp. IC2-477]